MKQRDAALPIAQDDVRVLALMPAPQFSRRETGNEKLLPVLVCAWGGLSAHLDEDAVRVVSIGDRPAGLLIFEGFELELDSAEEFNLPGGVLRVIHTKGDVVEASLLAWLGLVEFDTDGVNFVAVEHEYGRPTIKRAFRVHPELPVKLDGLFEVGDDEVYVVHAYEVHADAP